MSTPQTLWANRTLALLARMQQVGGIQVHWMDTADGACRIVVQASYSTATAVFEQDVLLRAFEGEDSAQVHVVVVLSELLRSLPMDRCG